MKGKAMTVKDVLNQHLFPWATIEDIIRYQSNLLPYCVIITMRGHGLGEHPELLLKGQEACDFNVMYLCECMQIQDAKRMEKVKLYLTNDEIAAIDAEKSVQ